MIHTLILKTKVDEVISDNKSREPASRIIVYIGRQKPMINYVSANPFLHGR